MELDGLLEDGGTAGGLVFCPEAGLGDDAVAERRDLRGGETKKKQRDRQTYEAGEVRGVSIGRQRVRVRTGETESEPLVKAKCAAYVPQVSEIQQKLNKEKSEIMKSNEVHSMRAHVNAVLPLRAMLTYKQKLTESGVLDKSHQILTDRKAWTMSALTELKGLSLITTKICSSFSKPMKFPNQDFLASLVDKAKIDQ